MADTTTAFVEPILFRSIYKITPRKISSSYSTDLVCHQRPSTIKLNVSFGLSSQRSPPKYIFNRNPVEQQTAVIMKKRKRSKSLFFVGVKPSTRRSCFSKSQTSNQEIRS